VFLRNAWYVAAMSAEVAQGLVPFTILAERIVAYRKANSDPVAFEDACPHRKLPLSMGRRAGDDIVCGYHGLTFDDAGRCIASPTQSRIPATARLRSYPVADRWGLLWIWMGDPARADASKIIAIESFDDPSWGHAIGGAMDCACNYLYLADNLLDPSHVAFVHPTSFAAPGTEETALHTDVKDDGVIVWRWILDREVPPYYAQLVKFEGRCDRLQHYEVRYPAVAINKSVFTPAGTGGPDKPLHPKAYVMISYHFLTPIDENATRYRWLQHRNTDPRNAKITAQITAGARAAFEEDRLVLEAVHRGMANKATPHINLALDAGSLRFRRELQALIDREQSSTPAGAEHQAPSL
jgi:phenylpropionate dioxygenase-like ring-hydroxylating dioxygenase large terminal subunit